MSTTLFGLTACGGSDVSSDELNAQIEDLTKQINEANSKISTLETEKVTQSAEITTLKSDMVVLEAEKATLATNKATLEAEKALLETEITDLKAEIARLQALMDGNSNALVEEIEELEAQIDALETEVDTLKSVKANLESEISTLNAQISSLNAEKANLTARITELEDLEAALRNCLKGIHTYENGACTTCGENQGDVAYVRCDKDGTPNANGEYLLFGEYPQTIKADDVTITNTTDTHGYYLGNDGYYYARITAIPFESGYTFSTGATVTSGMVYYFKVEPIRWRILSEGNGEAFILCDSIIANVAYQPDYYMSGNYYYTIANGAPEGTYANNYKHSNIRKWLNSTFYETAFSEFAKSIILITQVDNSLASNGDTSNPYMCENTNDKIFLLSCAEATNNANGFKASNVYNTAREMLTSDYSRATGTCMSIHSDYYGNGYWWLRSPYENIPYYAHLVISNGKNSYIHIDNDFCGVVPALRITL